MSPARIKLAMNPAWLMIPVAVPARDAGLEVRPTSKPIIDAGPPIPQTTTKSTRSANGAPPGHASTAVLVAAIPASTANTSVDLCHGHRVISHAKNGPNAMMANTMIVRSRPAAPALVPSPSTKKGSPTTGPGRWR